MKYEDIIGLPHHVSQRHPHMPVSDRAAQFAPFAALTGYGDVIKETARQTEERPELSEDERAALDYKLHAVLSIPGQKPEIKITYFVPDPRKSGGAFRKAAGRIRRVDEAENRIILELPEEDGCVSLGSVKNFVALVKNGSFLVRITDMTILIEKEFIYGSSKRPNPTDYYRKQHYQCG